MSLWWLLLPLVLLVLGASWALSEPSWSKPSGPYSVGSLLESTRSGEREISLRFFYPAEPPTTRAAPLLLLDAEGTKMPGKHVARLAGVNHGLASHRPELLAEYELPGSSHMNSGDMNFMPRMVRWFGLLGRIDGGVASRAVNEMVVAHFRQELLGESDARDRAAAKHRVLRPVSARSVPR